MSSESGIEGDVYPTEKTPLLREVFQELGIDGNPREQVPKYEEKATSTTIAVNESQHR